MSLQIALAWCLAWGVEKIPQININVLNQMRQVMLSGESVPEAVRPYVKQANRLSGLSYPENSNALKDLESEEPDLWKAKIGLIYGGATKIKQYVFESADLQEIRGASALLDRINLIDLPAFFKAEESEQFPLCQQATNYCQAVREKWLYREPDFSILQNALIPELIVYSTGGSILAFCPAALVDTLADAIEKRYTTETLTANSCAVGAVFYAPEIYLGLLPPQNNKVWQDTLQATAKNNPVVQAYFDLNKYPADVNTTEVIKQAFDERKGFSELTAKLENQFTQRRSGFDFSGRPSRRYPPMFETHPYLQRDDVDQRSAVTQIQAAQLPDTPKLSEPSARKRRVGQITKREGINDRWYELAKFKEYWNPEEITNETTFQSWVSKFEDFLRNHGLTSRYDPQFFIFDRAGNLLKKFKHEARSLNEIGDASKGYIAYIYADGNNMGQYIRDSIKTPEDYQRFSRDVFEATEQSVYWALAECMHPHYYKPDARSPRTNKKDPVYIHPFEIVAIGGDDVLLIVPGNKALEVAHKIGQYFEQILTEKGHYPIPDSGAPVQPEEIHRYSPASASPSTCCLSISSGVLITAANTPIYYADRLVTQLLKSSKKKAKKLKRKGKKQEKVGYYGGTVDILTLKAVTMISSDVQSFREEGLTVPMPDRDQELKLYASPYTLHELGGLIDTIRGFQTAGFPKSQLYQIRSLLERGKRTAILNYRYFRVRLSKENQGILKENFEAPWCGAKTNPGNLAPWLPPNADDDDDEANVSPEPKKTIYETLWRELVELFDFVEPKSNPPGNQTNGQQTTEVGGEQS